MMRTRVLFISIQAFRSFYFILKKFHAETVVQELLEKGEALTKSEKVSEPENSLDKLNHSSAMNG